MQWEWLKGFDLEFLGYIPDTYSVGHGLRPGVGKIFLLQYIKNPMECMWSGCRLPNAVVSQAHSGKPRCVLALPPQVVRITVAFGEKGLWVVWYNTGVQLQGSRAKNFAQN